jgi:hypothetical protein
MAIENNVPEKSYKVTSEAKRFPRRMASPLSDGGVIWVGVGGEIEMPSTFEKGEYTIREANDQEYTIWAQRGGVPGLIEKV